MIPYYKKLDKKIPNLSVVRGKSYERYGIEEDGKFIGVDYGEFFLQDKYSKDIFKNLMSVIPEEKRKYFSTSCMTVTHDIYPHIDDNINSQVNIYVKVNGGVTTFHTKKVDNVKDIKEVIGRSGSEYHKDSTSNIHDFSDVKDICSFVPKVGDVYIINTSILHSVRKDKSERILVCIQSSLGIQEVIEIFNDQIDRIKL